MNLVKNINYNQNNFSFKNEKNMSKEMIFENIKPDNKYIENSNLFYGKDLVLFKGNDNFIPKELEIIFDNLKDKNGKDFANSAYKGLIKYYGLEGTVPIEPEWEPSCDMKNIYVASDFAWHNNQVILYEDVFLNSGKTKEEQLGYIAHEITHMKQLSNIMRTEGLPLTRVASAFALFDFSSALRNNPIVQNQFLNAKRQGQEKDYTKYILTNLSARNYKELSNAYSETLKQPKHPLNSENGKKALNDLTAWANYNSNDWDAYENSPIEKEAMNEENKIKLLYFMYKKNN